MGAVVTGAVALSTSMTAAGSSSAEPASATIALPLPFPSVSTTDPPGHCLRREAGMLKIDEHGILHICTYIPGEGWYWIPE